MKEKRKKDAKIKVTPSSGNIFADIGLPNPEERLLKAKLARTVNKAIAMKGWTQTYTAQVLGITQPDVSELSRGRLKNFSVERLIYFLSKLDRRVTITVSSDKEDLPREEIVITAQKRVSSEAQVRQTR
jgi:predicted XRE-type DNA-binding protein